MSFLSEVKQSFFELLYPTGLACPACDAELYRGMFCPACKKELAPIDKACRRCGRKVATEGYCHSCKSRVPQFDGCVSVCEYTGAAKALLARLKNGGRYVSEAVAALMTEALKKADFEFDVIACVPLTQKVLKMRGYNQSELLARLIAESSGKPFDGESLIKARETAFQKDLHASERHTNIEGAFKLTDKEAFKGKRVLLIDDVMTTGSTLSECARTFKKGGAQKVFCLTFASVAEIVKLG